MAQPDIYSALKGMQKFLAAQRTGAKTFREPLYSRVDLVGLSAGVNQLLNPTDLRFFAVPVGQQGQGIARPLGFADTNLEGAGNQLPGGVEYIADEFGVYYDPRLPRQIKDILNTFSAVFQNRLSHIWKMGATRYWPAAEYGVQSISTTVNNTDYAVNGRMGSKTLPEGGEIYIPSKQVLDFVIRTEQAFNVTLDGTAATANLAADTFAFVDIVMTGWRFEVAAVG